MRHTLIFFSLFVLVGCQSQHQQKDCQQEYDLSSFEVIDLTNQRGETVSRDSMLLAHPRQLRYLDGGLLAISDIQNDNLLWVLDVKDGLFASGVRVGTGPDETGSISNLWVRHDTLWFSGMPEGKVGYVDIEMDSLRVTAHVITKSEGQSMKAISFGDAKILYQSMSPNCRFIWTNLLDNNTDTVGVFPDVPLPEGIIPRNSVFQTQLVASPNEDNLVQVNLSWNKIEIYDSSMVLQYMLTGPKLIESTIRKVELPFGVQYVQDPFISVFNHVTASNEQFIVGYIENDVDEAEVGSRCLLSFDWTGTPQKLYRFKDDIFAFDIDFKTMTLYAVQHCPDPCVKKYQL